MNHVAGQGVRINEKSKSLHMAEQEYTCQKNQKEEKMSDTVFVRLKPHYPRLGCVRGTQTIITEQGSFKFFAGKWVRVGRSIADLLLKKKMDRNNPASIAAFEMAETAKDIRRIEDEWKQAMIAAQAEDGLAQATDIIADATQLTPKTDKGSVDDAIRKHLGDDAIEEAKIAHRRAGGTVDEIMNKANAIEDDEDENEEDEEIMEVPETVKKKVAKKKSPDKKKAKVAKKKIRRKKSKA